MEIKGTQYTWIRLDLPEGLEAVESDAKGFKFKSLQPNAVVFGGMLLVKTKKKKGK
tara:strand:+ start:26 stop:193 length:168 start_codon:yes stop_codon:yes gene_type:complete